MLRHKSNYAVDRVQGWAPKRESATTLVGAGGHGWGRGRQRALALVGGSP